MILHQLCILNYKNIVEAELSFSHALNCIIGDNGEGKTNLLDAIRFLSLCKSISGAQDSMCIHHGEDAFMLKGLYYDDEVSCTTEIHCALRRGQKKILKRQGKPYKRLAEHIGQIPIVMVSPSGGELITGGSEERRRFLDTVISQMNPMYLDALNRYNKALMQRNALLKADPPCDVELLALWEEQMAREGEYIYECRKEFVETLSPLFEHYYRHISALHEEASVTYTSHCQRGPLIDVIQRDRAKDLAVGYSLHGTHRDDLGLLIDGYPIRHEGSQGQTKTMLIALKLAQYDLLRHTGRNTSPILLLDDIFDRLDSHRVERIVALVGSDQFGQTFITDTNRDHLDKILSLTNLDYRLFDCRAGHFTPISDHLSPTL